MLGINTEETPDLKEGSMKIIFPNTLCSVDRLPLFFLAGPIAGGGDWQEHCCMLLSQQLSTEFYVASPVRYDRNHPLRAYELDGTRNYFSRQLLWERYYLDIAGRPHRWGCIIFWLPEESETDPRADGFPYAMDTRGELGEWRGRMMYDGYSHVVIGAEPGFPGLDQIVTNFRVAISNSFPIYPTLTETVKAALCKSG